MTPHFNTALNLHHAATLSNRIVSRLSQVVPVEEDSESLEQAHFLMSEMLPYFDHDYEPSVAETMVMREHMLDLARHLVQLIEFEGHKSDRLGQSVRNLFECLAADHEGAMMGLRAGENPNSLQRPR